MTGVGWAAGIERIAMRLEKFSNRDINRICFFSTDVQRLSIDVHVVFYGLSMFSTDFHVFSNGFQWCRSTCTGNRSCHSMS